MDLDEAENVALTASIGWALYPDDATTVDELVGVADECVRTVKLSGKDRRALAPRSLGAVRPLRVLHDSFPDDPALDAAVSRATLERVAAGELPETLRLARPARVVAFAKRDVLAPGYAQAVAGRARGGLRLGAAAGRRTGGGLSRGHAGARPRRARPRPARRHPRALRGDAPS